MGNLLKVKSELWKDVKVEGTEEEVEFLCNFLGVQLCGRMMSSESGQSDEA